MLKLATTPWRGRSLGSVLIFGAIDEELSQACHWQTWHSLLHGDIHSGLFSRYTMAIQNARWLWPETLPTQGLLAEISPALSSCLCSL